MSKNKWGAANTAAIAVVKYHMGRNSFTAQEVRAQAGEEYPLAAIQSALRRMVARGELEVRFRGAGRRAHRYGKVEPKPQPLIELITEEIERLRALRRRLCCYAGSDQFCDCKYLLTPEHGSPTGFSKATPPARGEQTGCCEMREAIAALEKVRTAHTLAQEGSSSFGTKKPKRDGGECTQFTCERAKLVRLVVGQSLQTGNGFLIAKVEGWYCPKCAGSYGDY